MHRRFALSSASIAQFLIQFRAYYMFQFTSLQSPMFPACSPTFSKLKCPSLTDNTPCPLGPDLCVFSHDPSVYIKGGLDGRIGLSSLTYFKDLQKRMRTEETACRESKLFDNKQPTTIPIPSTDKISKAMENDLTNFLHRAPAGCRISLNLREKVLLKLIKSMRQTDAGSTLSQAAEVEGELIVRSGGGKITSVYLSSVAEYIKRNTNREFRDDSVSISAAEDVTYEDLREILASKEILAEYFYPIKCDEFNKTELVGSSDSPQRCRRCGITFTPSKYYAHIDQSNGPTERMCRYHEGKIEKIGGLRVYGCCQAPVGDSNGCETRPLHVFEGFKKNDPITRFPKLNGKDDTANSSLKAVAVALDAEMFYTVGGYEVSRVTAVDFFSEESLLDVLVLPRHPPVLDYNTKWSGVSADSYKSGELPVLGFAEMQAKLAEIIGEETILIGHSLDNDLRVLEFQHDLIVDTAILYPHPSRPPYRMSLKALALGHLSELVQQSLDGHDSREDCVTCVRLIKRHFEKKRGIKRI